MKKFFVVCICLLFFLMTPAYLFLVTIANTGSRFENPLTEDDFRRIVEDSKIRVFDRIYHGVYDVEEILELPNGFELIGEIVDDNGKLLSSHLTSNSFSAGTKIYSNENDISKIYVKVSYSEDGLNSYQNYLLYVLEE